MNRYSARAVQFDHKAISAPAPPVQPTRGCMNRFSTVPGIAVPPTNDVDVFAQDLGLIAIIQHGELLGFNVAVGLARLDGHWRIDDIEKTLKPRWTMSKILTDAPNAFPDAEPEKK